MPIDFTLPPNTRAVGTGDPANDMNALVNLINDEGYQFSILNTAWSGGAYTDNTSNSTAAIQACMNAAAAAGLPVLIPGGIQFRVSQLTWNAGQVIQGVYSGTYPGNNSITTASVLVRIASTNLDLITVPDGTNYGAIRDIAIDGNKNNNTSGVGFSIVDGAAGQETQIIIERCYFHDNPGSNIYLGHNRRANKVINSVITFSGSGDGVTIAGSDNTVNNNLIGGNSRAGVCLGTTITQNWSAAASPNAAAVAHVTNNDIFTCQVGIAVASSGWGNVIAFNGIDRCTKQGITVYDGAANTIIGNSFHSNGTLTNNTYGHIDVATGVTQVEIAGNVFGPLDGGISNVASYAVAAASGAPAGCINGDLGVIDATSTVNGLINLPAKRFAPPGAATSTFKPANPAATVSTTLVMMGVGSTCVFTPQGSGKVVATISGGWTTATASINGVLSARYGTGTAPVNGAAGTGTRWGTGSSDMSVRAGSTAGNIPFSFTEVLSLTPGTAYWFDLVTSTASASDAATITNVQITLQEMPV